METLTQTLTDSVTYEKHERQLEKAAHILELSKLAYLRHLDFTARADREASVLASGNWRKFPFVTEVSHQRAIHNADISMMASSRLMKAYKRILFKLFCSSKLF